MVSALCRLVFVGVGVERARVFPWAICMPISTQLREYSRNELYFASSFAYHEWKFAG